MRTKMWIRHTVWIALVCMGIFIAAEVEAQRGGERGGGGGGGGGRSGGGGSSFSGGGGGRSGGGGGSVSRSGTASSGSWGSRSSAGGRSSGSQSFSRSGTASSGSLGSSASSAQGSRSSAQGVAELLRVRPRAARRRRRRARQSSARQGNQRVLAIKPPASPRLPAMQATRQSSASSNQANRQSAQSANREDWQGYGNNAREDRQDYGSNAREDGPRIRGGLPWGLLWGGVFRWFRLPDWGSRSRNGDWGHNDVAAAFNAQKASCSALVVNGVTYQPMRVNMVPTLVSGWECDLYRGQSAAVKKRSCCSARHDAHTVSQASG